MNISDLIKILEISQKKNGADFPLTVGHLLNIVKMTQRVTAAQLARDTKAEEDAHNQFMADEFRYGND